MITHRMYDSMITHRMYDSMITHRMYDSMITYKSQHQTYKTNEDESPQTDKRAENHIVW